MFGMSIKGDLDPNKEGRRFAVRSRLGAAAPRVGLSLTGLVSRG
jgi:hypothetical protein